jgi:predicted nucleic acid-binding protein
MNAIPFKHDHLVLDTSVVIKWYRQDEILASHALILRDAYLAGQAAVVVPSLLIYELANVLRYKNDLSVNQVQEAVQSLFDMELQVVPPSSPVMQQAVDLAQTHDLTIYDATFVALAQALAATCVTADERLAQRLTALTFVHALSEIQIVETDS